MVKGNNLLKTLITILDKRPHKAIDVDELSYNSQIKMSKLSKMLDYLYIKGAIYKEPDNLMDLENTTYTYYRNRRPIIW